MPILQKDRLIKKSCDTRSLRYERRGRGGINKSWQWQGRCELCAVVSTYAVRYTVVYGCWKRRHVTHSAAKEDDSTRPSSRWPRRRRINNAWSRQVIPPRTTVRPPRRRDSGKGVWTAGLLTQVRRLDAVVNSRLYVNSIVGTQAAGVIVSVLLERLENKKKEINRTCRRSDARKSNNFCCWRPAILAQVSRGFCGNSAASRI